MALNAEEITASLSNSKMTQNTVEEKKAFLADVTKRRTANVALKASIAEAQARLTAAKTRQTKERAAIKVSDKAEAKADAKNAGLMAVYNTALEEFNVQSAKKKEV
jgi:hypothetical protein